jgi:hypothetical protein
VQDPQPLARPVLPAQEVISLARPDSPPSQNGGSRLRTANTRKPLARGLSARFACAMCRGTRANALALDRGRRLEQAELLHQRHGVEVLTRLLDRVAVEREDDAGARGLMLAGRLDLTLRG